MSTTITIRLNRRLVVWWSSIAAAILVGWLALSPYFVVWRLQSAAGDQNADALSALVDFESVRSSLKEFLYAQWLDSVGDDQDGFAALGTTLGVMLVDSLIDRFVTPHGFAALMRNPERGLETEEPPDDVIDDISLAVQTRKAYEAPNRFVFETWATGMDDQRVGFVLKRNGLSWRVTGLRLPLPPPREALARESTAGPEDTPGYWHIAESVDPIDDRETITAMVLANGGRSFGTSPMLVVRCAKDKTDAFINWTDYLGSANSVDVVVRWNDETAKTERWSASTDHTATFAPRPIAVVRALMEHDRLVVRTVPYSDAPSTLVFDLTGGSKRFALETISEKCRFEEKDRERERRQQRAEQERRRAISDLEQALDEAKAAFAAWEERLASAPQHESAWQERLEICMEKSEHVDRAIGLSARAREMKAGSVRDQAVDHQLQVATADC